MALRKIVTVGDPILTKVCRPVTKFDQKLAILIEDMIETMHDANGVGLAGPQVGILRRVVVVDAGDEDEGDEILARCFLHEIDHLDGHMYTEIAEKMLTPEELAALEQQEADNEEDEG